MGLFLGSNLLKTKPRMPLTLPPISFLSDRLKKSDDFLGRAFYLLQTIPVQGEVRNLALYSHSGKSQQGSVKLRLSIRGLREDVPVEVALKEYLMLLKAIVSFDSRKVGSSWGAFVCFDYMML